VKVGRQAVPHGNSAGYSWTGMHTLVKRMVLQRGWEKEQATRGDSLEEDKLERLAHQGQVAVMVALMNRLGLLGGYVQGNVVGMDHNSGICGRTVAKIV